MNHKRARPKHQRAGCLHCKPHKDERVGKSAGQAASVRRVLQSVVEEDPPCPLCGGLDSTCCNCGYCAGCHGVELDAVVEEALP